MLNTKLLLVAGIFSLAAQTQPPPEFEVAAVKPSDPTARSIVFQTLPGGRFTVEHAALLLLVRNAYSVKNFQILGLPGWANSEGWDITAKAAGNATGKELMVMLQTLLEDRFKLKLHHETREVPIYTLSAGKNGLKLRNVKEASCEVPDPSKAQPANPCGRVMAMLESRAAKLLGKNITTAELARVLGNVIDRPVLDKTGFKGTFDIDMDYTPDQIVAVLPGAGAEPDAGGTSIFAAFQQLGLKLEAAKGPVDVLVIDHVERPGAN